MRQQHRGCCGLQLLGSFVVLSALLVPAATVYAWSSNSRSDKRRCESPLPPPPKNKDETSGGTHRRKFLSRAAFGIFAATGAPAVSRAGEIGARITQAVTTSDLGVSVRRSVVRGAQVMDSLDLQAERLSDRLGLGSERSNRPGKPGPIVIPALQPLDALSAAQILHAADRVFCDVSGIRPGDLQAQVKKVTDTVQPSFERSGLSLPPNVLETGAQFNFASYVHFKAYSDLIIDKRIDFRKFKKPFEDRVGQHLAILLVPDWKSANDKISSSTPDDRRTSLATAVERIDGLSSVLISKGLIARIDLAPLDPDDVEDWSQSLADLSWSIALDGDITLQSQILLQEQGFRLYPNYARYAIQTVLQRLLDDQEITAEDYYMDTDYNSDPDKFEVKEVLVNISIESKL